MHYCHHAADLFEDKPGTTMGSTGGGVSAMNQTITRQHYLNYIFEWWVTTRIDSYINHKVLNASLDFTIIKFDSWKFNIIKMIIIVVIIV